MAKVTTAQISDDVLASKVETSDRLVYSNYFVPFVVTFDDGLTPVIPFYVKHQLLDLVAYGGLNMDRLQAILSELKAPELWAANQMDTAREHWHKTSIVALSDHLDPGGVVRRIAGDGLNSVARDIQETAGLLTVLKAQLDTSGQEILHLAEGRLGESMRELAERSAADRSVSAQPSVLGNQDVEVVAGLLQSQIGYGFLDRTRISPVGFAVGERVFTHGLAPGEEVVLEQKTFTKRLATFEEEIDQERQFDIELSSTYSTELQEGFERQRARNDQWDVHYTKNWSYTSPFSIYGTWATDNNFNYNKSVTEASQGVRRRSVKENQQASSKISARYRAQHKTVFRVTTEQGYEASARRTIRNPNRTTPLTLHFFKALQRLRLRQERYGVRLCWAPVVNAPGAQMLIRLRAGRQRILDEAAAKLPPPPKKPSASTDGTSSKREEKVFASAVTHADQHNWTAGQNYDYDVEVTVPQGWSWDEVPQNVRIDTSASLRTPGTYSVYKIGIPVLSEGGVMVRVHVDAGDRAGAQAIYFQVTIVGVKDGPAPPGTAQNEAYLAALEDWRTEVGEWEAARRRPRSGGRCR